MYNSIYNLINVKGNFNGKCEGYGGLNISFILKEANFNQR